MKSNLGSSSPAARLDSGLWQQSIDFFPSRPTSQVRALSIGCGEGFCAAVVRLAPQQHAPGPHSNITSPTGLHNRPEKRDTATEQEFPADALATWGCGATGVLGLGQIPNYVSAPKLVDFCFLTEKKRHMVFGGRKKAPPASSTEAPGGAEEAEKQSSLAAESARRGSSASAAGGGGRRGSAEGEERRRSSSADGMLETDDTAQGVSV